MTNANPQANMLYGKNKEEICFLKKCVVYVNDYITVVFICKLNQYVYNYSS